MLRRGNREAATDIVLLITDGKSQDNVVLPAKRVRDAGALVCILFKVGLQRHWAKIVPTKY